MVIALDGMRRSRNRTIVSNNLIFMRLLFGRGIVSSSRSQERAMITLSFCFGII
jgi:hypothetical protein